MAVVPAAVSACAAHKAQPRNSRFHSPICWIFSSGIQPLFKSRIDSLEHLSVHLSLIGELLAPACVIFLSAFHLGDELLDQCALIRMPVSEMLFAKICGVFLPMFGSHAHRMMVLSIRPR
jgi:hypothetical protein